MKITPSLCNYVPQLLRCQCGLQVVTRHHSWTCLDPACRAREAWRWKRRLASVHIERFITITNVPLDDYRPWKDLIRAIRCRWKVGAGGERARGHSTKRRFEYVRVLELGEKAGMRHYHVGQRGDYLPKAELRTLCKAHGFGWIDDIEEVRDQTQCQAYLAKYLTKAAGTPGERKVTTSRGFIPKVDESPDVDGEHRCKFHWHGDAHEEDIEEDRVRRSNRQ